MLNFISCNFYNIVHTVLARLRPSYISPLYIPLLSKPVVLGIDPYTQRNIFNLEKVQRRDARLAFCDYSHELSVSCTPSALEWPLLNGKHVFLSHSQTRCSDDLKLNHLPACTDVIKFSFFPCTIPIWNSLPQEIVHAVSPASFSARVVKLVCQTSKLFLLLTIVCLFVCLHNEMQCLPVIHHM